MDRLLLEASDSGESREDMNASPFHLAWAEVDEEGNLKSYGRIDLGEFIGKSRNQRKNLMWEIAYKVVKLAKEKGRGFSNSSTRVYLRR